MAADPLLRAQPHPQAVHDARPQDVDALGIEAIEIGAGIVGQQHPKRLFELAGAPIGEFFLALRVGHDRGR